MSHQRLILLLAGLSAAAIIGGAVVIICLEPTQYDALGSLLGALASMIAVIWFSGSLYYQAVQLKEQREQFSLELKEQREQFAVQFRQLREDARRNALTLAKDILREAEDAALKANPSLQSINELTTAYLVPVSPLKTLMESTDPVEVRDSMADWLKIEAPPVSLMHGIKTAA